MTNFLTVVLLALVLPANTHAKTFTVAAIDTGFGWHDKGKDVKLCKYGHKDFSGENKYTNIFKTKDRVPYDTNGHGTHIAGLINKYAGKSDFCLVVIKYVGGNVGSESNFESALKHAIKLNVDMINFSGGGTEYSSEEAATIKKFLDKGGIFVAAAGNEQSDLDLKGKYYPAMDDDRVIIVGNKAPNGAPSFTSNYGSIVTRWEFGERVEMYGLTLTGTSQSTAIASGKIINERSRTRKSRNYVVGQ